MRKAQSVPRKSLRGARPTPSVWIPRPLVSRHCQRGVGGCGTKALVSGCEQWYWMGIWLSPASPLPDSTARSPWLAGLYLTAKKPFCLVSSPSARYFSADVITIEKPRSLCVDEEGRHHHKNKRPSKSIWAFQIFTSCLPQPAGPWAIRNNSHFHPYSQSHNQSC